MERGNGIRWLLSLVQRELERGNTGVARQWLGEIKRPRSRASSAGLETQRQYAELAKRLG